MCGLPGHTYDQRGFYSLKPGVTSKTLKIEKNLGGEVVTEQPNLYKFKHDCPRLTR